MAYKDPETRRAYRRKYYASNPQRYLDANQKARDKIRAYIKNLKESTPCADCATSYPHYVMDFDHLSDKSFNLAKAYLKQSLNRVKEEISKCEIVCANCHRIRTNTRRAAIVQQIE